ncbi:putative uncharacterized protein [Carnobacterium maltaromaticum LMA28]|uniref:DUF5067 domain-containing protein n=1 Tax=Carnobacterium maltaromaticum LMA28 TaxID=1234679 RepID=K8E654_CARML|nr:DUF5067 domain-containing protein [Carnobacterium maltaromaticum]CCO12239.1 putative uncharacterized protein [Carnobacterium maltaromaticum LMA28]
MKKIISLGFISLCVVALSACGAPEKKSEKTSEQKSSQVQKESVSEKKKTDDVTYSDKTIENKDGKVKITSIEKGVDFNDEPAMIVHFELTNKKTEPENVQIAYMSFIKAEQNTGDTTENLQYAIMTENPYQDKTDMLQKDINPNATIEGVYMYELADETKPVTLKFLDGMFGKEVATEEITVQ